MLRGSVFTLLSSHRHRYGFAVGFAVYSLGQRLGQQVLLASIMRNRFAVQTRARLVACVTAGEPVRPGEACAVLKGGGLPSPGRIAQPCPQPRPPGRRNAPCCIGPPGRAEFSARPRAPHPRRPLRSESRGVTCRCVKLRGASLRQALPPPAHWKAFLFQTFPVC